MTNVIDRPERIILLVTGEDSTGGEVEALATVLGPLATETALRYERCSLVDIWDAAEFDPLTGGPALERLVPQPSPGEGERRPSLAGRLRHQAMQIAHWAVDPDLRKQLHDRLRHVITTVNPTALCVHGPAALVAYDLFARNPEIIRDRFFITSGSPLGLPYVRALFGGRIQAPDGARSWHNLTAIGREPLTAALHLYDDSYEQVTLSFPSSAPAGRSACDYLTHPDTVERVWREVIGAHTVASTRSGEVWRILKRRPVRRALLVGINDYPDPAARLEGCVNDTYLMSGVLQELGFPAENIRVVLDRRATAAAIRERLEWLLDGAGPEDHRVFFYSGHGAQIPAYGPQEEVDRLDECLVPTDFDWTPERAVVDDWFCELYSQLPYETAFIALFDCCHAGGLTRSGSRLVRGIDPPDDIRHRLLRWDGQTGVWLPRVPTPAVRFADDDAHAGDYLGRTGTERRLGRGVPLWSPAKEFRKARKEYRHHGPYTPVILEACREREVAAEYRHGTTSHGAFTYCLAESFRQLRNTGVPPTWEALVTAATDRLRALEYRQTPILVCPKEKRGRPAW